MTTTSGGNYEEFRAFPERAAAESLCSWLEFEGVPTYIRPRTLASGLEADFVVFVATKLAHRARWIVAQLPPSDAELEFLATGKLPGQEEK